MTTLLSTAQVWNVPAETWVGFESPPGTVLCPKLSQTQQTTPLSSSAQVCPQPAETWVGFESPPGTVL